MSRASVFVVVNVLVPNCKLKFRFLVIENIEDKQILTECSSVYFGRCIRCWCWDGKVEAVQAFADEFLASRGHVSLRVFTKVEML